MSRKWFALGLLSAGVAAAMPASAESMLAAQTGMISGKQSFVVPLEISGSGRLSVSLSDLGWLGRLSDLSFSLTKNNQLLTASAGSRRGLEGGLWRDVLNFDLTGPGIYHAYVTATAGGKYGVGIYSLQIGVTDTPSPVPAPAAGLLLLSALGGFAAWKKRFGRATSPLNDACVA
jgi:hypothetical protein